MSILIKKTHNILEKTGCIYIVFLFLIFFLKWPFLTVGPVWDDAFSIFPAADFLVNHGFNYFLLLNQPSFYEGGPTAHALSLLSLVTALVLKITGGGINAWVVLHAMQFLMTAAIGTILTRIYSALFDNFQSFLLAVASLTYPLMSAQIGCMYIEVPLLFFSLLAFYQYRKNHIWLTSLFLFTACLTKESAIIAAGAIAVSALFCKSKPMRRRVLDIFIISMPAIVAYFLLTTITNVNPSISSFHGLKDSIGIILNSIIVDCHVYMFYIPELMFIFGMSIVLALFFLSKSVYRYMNRNEETGEIVTFNSLLIVLFLIFHFVICTYFRKNDFHILSRYFFYIVPSMFFIIYFSLSVLIKKEKIKIILLAVVIGINIVNRGGILYPVIPFTSIPTEERSEEYIKGYHLQKEYIKMLEKKISPEVPIYANLSDYFLTHYPVSQYVEKPLTNVHYIGRVSKSKGKDLIFPDHFVLTFHYSSMGGEIIWDIAKSLHKNEAFNIEVLGYLIDGKSEAYIFEIRRKTSKPAIKNAKI